MKLGLLSQWYDPEPGGGAVPGVLANGLADRGHDIKVLTGFPNYPHGRIYPGYRQRWRHDERGRDRVAIRRTPLYPDHGANPLGRAANYLSFGASALARGLPYLADREAIWVFNSPAPVGAVARQLSRRRGVPFLLHVMDVWPDSVLDSGMLSNGALNRVADRVLGDVVRRTHDAAAVVAVTSPGQEALLNERGVPSHKLRYIPVWANEEIFRPRPAHRELLPEPARDADIVLMYAGAMGHIQQLDAAVRAASAVGPALHLVLVGTGVAEVSLRGLAQELQADNVHFMGSQPPTAMGELSAAADAHLVSLADTPLMRVTMPSKVQSIMALGRAIVATCAGDAAAVIESAGAGVALVPGDHTGLIETLRALLQAPEQLVAWGEAGRRHYEAEFAQAKAVNRVEEALQDAAAQR